MPDWLRRLARNEHPVLDMLAPVAVNAAAYGAVLFRYGVNVIQAFTFGITRDTVALPAAHPSWWHILLVPTGGGLPAGLTLHRLHDGRMPLRHNLASPAVHTVSLGFGASIGREDEYA